MHFLCALDGVIFTLMASMTGVDTYLYYRTYHLYVTFLYLKTCFFFFFLDSFGQCPFFVNII